MYVRMDDGLGLLRPLPFRISEDNSPDLNHLLKNFQTMNHNGFPTQPGKLLWITQFGTNSFSAR